LYGFIFNEPTSGIDPWGLEDPVDCDEEFRQERRQNFKEGAELFHTVKNEIAKELVISALPLGPVAKIFPADLMNKTRSQIRALAQRLGLAAKGKLDNLGLPRKWYDPITSEQRLRLDRGHIDPTTGMPYNDPKARVDHAHGYEPDGTPIVDPTDCNPHFPTTGE